MAAVRICVSIPPCVWQEFTVCLPHGQTGVVRGDICRDKEKTVEVERIEGEKVARVLENYKTLSS